MCEAEDTHYRHGCLSARLIILSRSSSSSLALKGAFGVVGSGLWIGVFEEAFDVERFESEPKTEFKYKFEFGAKPASMASFA